MRPPDIPPLHGNRAAISHSDGLTSGGKGFEPSGPHEEYYDHETAPFDRYGIPFGNKGPMRTREGPTVRIRLPPAKSLQTISSAAAEPITADHRRTAGTGVRREKAALSSGCKAHPATRSSRKRSEQSWR